MPDVVRHAATVAEPAAPRKQPTSPMHDPKHRHAQVQCDAGAQACRAALLRAIEILGGGAAAARSLGVPGQARQTVYQWTRARVPAEYCPAIERQTRLVGRPIFCEQLRPDVDWGALRPIAAGPATCFSPEACQPARSESFIRHQEPSMTAMPITLPQLEAAARQWVTENRAGENLSDDEVGALAIEHVAAESAAHLLWYLRGTAARAGDLVLRVSLAHVRGVMLGWEKSRRSGLCLAADRVAGLAVDQVAAEMAAYLWECFSIAAGPAACLSPDAAPPNWPTRPDFFATSSILTPSAVSVGLPAGQARLTITLAQLRVAMFMWEGRIRSGNLASHEQAAALPLAQAARESAAALWSLFPNAAALLDECELGAQLSADPPATPWYAT